MKNGLLYTILAVVSLGVGLGAGVLAKSLGSDEPEPYVPRTAAVKTDPVRVQPVEQPVTLPVTETVAEEQPAAPREEKVREDTPVQPKAVTVKPVEQLNKKDLELVFNSGNGDNLTKYKQRFANFSKCPVYCGDERKTLSQIVSDVSNSYPPVKAVITSMKYDTLGRVTSVRVRLDPAQ